MSDCSCIDTSNDDGYSVCLSQKIVKARKKHRCGECHQVILPGQEYERYTGIYDGDFFTAKTCSDCLSLRESEIFCGNWRFGVIWDDFFDALREGGDYGILGEDGVPWTELSTLTPAAKDRVFDWIEYLWEEYEEYEEHDQRI